VAAGVPKQKLTIALCRTSGGDEEAAARAYLAEAGYPVLAGSMPERGAYREALNVGRAPTETSEPALNDRVDALMDALLATVMDELKAASAPRRKGTAA
jgi:chromosome partitioning protein